jgi:uncharacterized protein
LTDGTPIAAPAPRLAPVAEAERITSVDTLRGFALLGILAMNIYAFSMPFQAYANPLLYGGTGPLDLGTWFFTHVVFDLKFMAIFSMLFGAGLILMSERATAGGARFAATYYKRLFWLIVFGLVHAYLIWFGDILFSYGVCGLVLYPLRKLRPRTLLVLGGVLLLIGVIAAVVLGQVVGLVKEGGEAAEQALAAGETLTETEEGLRAAWEDMRGDFAPTAEQLAEDVEVHRGGWSGIAVFRAPTVLTFQTVMFLFFTFWRAAGLMLLGMGLMKLGVFSATRSPAFYRGLAASGYGVGLPMVAFSAFILHDRAWDPMFVMQGGSLVNYVGSIAVALGHVGLVMLVCRSGALGALRSRLAAVGRMAFSNYLLHSVLLTTVFYGYGFGLYGTLGRFGQMGVVAAVWVLQLAISPWWLGRFRYGPAEWLWRSLTYGRRARLVR